MPVEAGTQYIYENISRKNDFPNFFDYVFFRQLRADITQANREFSHNRLHTVFLS